MYDIIRISESETTTAAVVVVFDSKNQKGGTL